MMIKMEREKHLNLKVVPVEDYKEIKPQQGMTKEAADDFWANFRQNQKEKDQ